MLVKEKDIIIFLGDTGTGKSTSIHFLAGSKMR
jgi:ABC-type sugar transport system ATPase subunit